MAFAPSLDFVCFGFFGVLAFLSIRDPSRRARESGRSSHRAATTDRDQALDASIFSTKSARQAGASNGFAKYSVIFATLPSRTSPMPT